MSTPRLYLLLLSIAIVAVFAACAPLTPVAPALPTPTSGPSQATATSAVLTSQPPAIQPTAAISPTPDVATATSIPSATATVTETVAPATSTAAVQTSQPPEIQPTSPISGTATVQTPMSTGTPGTPSASRTSTSDDSTPQEATADPDDPLGFLPMGEGRTLLLANCSNCHSFVCAVIGERTEGALRSVRATHLERVSSLTEEELDTLFAYLYDNFGQGQPQPELPPALEGQGCTAQ